jgi:phosphate transport system ATP-binding protein
VEALIVGLRGRYRVLIVTHNLAQALRIADYAALFWIQNGAGELIEAGTAKQIFAEPCDPLPRPM